MYAGCAVGDLTLANQVVATAEKAAQTTALLQASPLIQSPPEQEDDDGDDDDDDDEMMDTTTAGGSSTAATAAAAAAPPASTVPPTTARSSFTSAAEYAAQPLFGLPKPKSRAPVPEVPVRQLGEAPLAARSRPVVDEDGFAPVEKRKSRNKNPVY